MSSQHADGQRIPIPAWARARRSEPEIDVARTPAEPITFDRICGVACWKRLLDVVLSLVALALAAPLLCVAAALVKMTSPGPVFFVQERVGLDRRTRDRHGNGNGNGNGMNGDCRRRRERRAERKYGKPFTMYKFRTMYVSSENGTPAWARKNDPRITSVGRILRRTRIDEIPQFYNVLKGDMSLVGPRPERAYFMRKHETDVPEFKYRLRTKPGITGLAQVRLGYASDVNGMRHKLDHDLEYIRNLSPVNDFKIMLKTVGVVVTGKGAY